MITTHPDARMIEQASSALTWWAEQTPPTATSSITGGGAIADLEHALLKLLNAPCWWCLALPSGTAALSAALSAIGVIGDDDVLCPAYDWHAASTMIRALGARPVYVDVDPRTGTIDPDAARRCRTRVTTACVATHLFGVPADIPALQEALPDLPVIEDAAQALGSSLDGRAVGTLGTVSVFSFGPGKTIDAGEGGALVVRDRALYERAVQATQHPIRQILTGLPARPSPHSTRIAPIAALLAAYQMHQLLLDLDAKWTHRAAIIAALGIPVLGDDTRRRLIEPDLITIGEGTVIPNRTPSTPGATWQPEHEPPMWIDTLTRWGNTGVGRAG